MRYQVNFILFFSVIVSGQEKDFYAFSRDEQSLTECLEDYLLKNDDPYYKEAGTASILANLVAKRFFERSKTRKSFIAVTSDLFQFIKTKKSYVFKNHEIYKPLLEAIRKALIYCADIPTPAPIFADEPRELADVLDFILVDWTDSLQEMLTNNYGRLVLRKYAENALEKLVIALNYIGNLENFRHTIRKLWNRRAQLYFDGHSEQFPYLLHAYAMDTNFCTYGNTDIFSLTRSTRNFSHRNPFIKVSKVVSFLNLHDADRSEYISSENDIFGEYSISNPMTSAEYYIDTHIDQFYRILHFLRIFKASIEAKSIINDIWPLNIPYEVLSLKNQAMLYDDKIYRKILIRERKHINRNLERFSMKSQIEMGLILCCNRIYKDYWNYLRFYLRDRHRTSTPVDEDRNYVLLPQLYWESDNLRFILDLILVDWPLSLRDMVRLRSYRLLLRRYASESKEILERILDTTGDLMLFRYSIREMWLRRAELYFDGRNVELPYIPHRYIEGRGLRTNVAMNLFYHRSSESFSVRNPQVSADRINLLTESQPSTSQGLNSADYYLQVHIEQFYRIIFFFNHLNLRDLSINNEDELDLPEESLQILLSDVAYSNYLLSLRRHLEKTKINIGLSFAGSLEENLIYMMSLPDIEDIINCKTFSENSTIFSTTPKYDLPKRKGNFRNHKYGKCPRKSSSITFSEQQEQQQQYEGNRYGYIIDDLNFNFNQQLFMIKNHRQL